VLVIQLGLATAVLVAKLGLATAQLPFQSQIALVLLTHRGFPTRYETKGKSRVKAILKGVSPIKTIFNVFIATLVFILDASPRSENRYVQLVL